MTLLEVMVAIAVLSIVSMTIWTATSQTSRTTQIVEASHDRLHQVRVALDMIINDLASAFLSLHRSPSETTHDTIFVGENNGDEDRLDFASFSHQRRYLDANESDQCEVGYFVADDPEDSDIKNLIRRESPILDLEPFEGGQHLVLIKDVVEFDLEYFDFVANEWQDEWDSSDADAEAGTLPHQVRIRLVVNNRKGEPVVYGTQVSIPMRTPIWRKGFIPGMPLSVRR